MGLNKNLHLLGLLLLGLVVVRLFWPPASSAQDPDGVLKDPVVLGAWLYEGNCVRCHGPYENERVGSSLSEDELVKAIEKGGCRITWARRYGGPLNNREVEALVLYILTWKELGGPPNLPELPPQPTPTPPATRPSADLALATPTPTPTPALDERTRFIISSNPLARGAWLYVQNCHHCHQNYEATRMGRGIAEETVKYTIENGKTTTQMKPFSRTKGGNLKNRDIEAIVLYITSWEELGAPPALPDNIMTPPTPDPADLIPVALPEIPLVEGDVHHGGKLYTLYCRKCHGELDEGRIGPRLVRDWRSVRPDLTVRSTIVQGVPGSPMPAWGQARGGPLSEQDVNDLVAYVLSRSPQQESPALFVIASASSPVWSGWLGFLALLAGPLLLGIIAFIAAPKRE